MDARANKIIRSPSLSKHELQSLGVFLVVMLFVAGCKSKQVTITEQTQTTRADTQRQSAETLYIHNEHRETIRVETTYIDKGFIITKIHTENVARQQRQKENTMSLSSQKINQEKKQQAKSKSSLGKKICKGFLFLVIFSIVCFSAKTAVQKIRCRA